MSAKNRRKLLRKTKKFVRHEICSIEDSWSEETEKSIRLLQLHVVECMLNNCKSARWWPEDYSLYVRNGYDLSTLETVLNECKQELEQEIEEMSFMPLHNDNIHDKKCAHRSNRHGGIYVQRAVKRKQRALAKEGPRKLRRLVCEPKHDPEITLELKERVPHNKGHGAHWARTRNRYWRPDNNNWKQHGKLQKQWMKNL